MDISTSPAPEPRRDTRDAIVDGALKLIHRGDPVTVEAAAALHGISKATAYRYFRDVPALVLEAGLFIDVTPYEQIVAEVQGLRARLLAITMYCFELAQTHETQFRRFLSHNLEAIADGRAPDTRRNPVRQAYLERAVKEARPHERPQDPWKMVAALTVITGGEAMMALTDISRLDQETARDVVRDLALAVTDRYLGPAL